MGGEPTGDSDATSDCPAASVSAPRIDVLLDELCDRNAGVLVVAGTTADPAVRYLAGDALDATPARPAAVAVVREGPTEPDETTERDGATNRDGTTDRDDRIVTVVGPTEGAAPAPPQNAVLADRSELPARRLVTELDDIGVDGPLLAPPAISYDAVLYLEEAFELASTDTVARARRAKTPAELDRIATAQDAAAAGMDRAREVLRTAEPDVEGDGDRNGDGNGNVTVLRWDGDVLTAGRLRREIDTALASAGADPAANTAVAAGRGVGRRPADDDPLHAGEPIVVDLAPREPAGYHGSLARTYVVEGDAGWERRAHVAVERAAQAARAVLEAGAGSQAGVVHREGAAELAAYGFDPDGEPGLTHRIGYGVGLEPRERPILRGDSELRPGDVVAVGPSIADGDREVRLRGLLVVREDGADVVAEYPTTIRP